MALPELTLPDGTPAFSVDNHSIDLVPMFADTAMRTGHDRRRRVYTTVPRSVSVKLELTLAQALAFYNWFEDSLQAGVLEFSAQVANQGPGLLWWRARFTEPYTAEAHESGQAVFVSGKLRLIGDGSSVGPYTPNLVDAVTVAFNGTAVIVTPLDLSDSVTVALTPRGEPLSDAVLVSFISTRDGAAPSTSEFEIRWLWQRYPYAAGRTSDVTETQDRTQRAWMRI